MKLDEGFADLQRLLDGMGAKPRPVDLGKGLEGRVGLPPEGVEIDPRDVAGQAGVPFIWQGDPVVLYIKDTNKSEQVLRTEPENAVKFHLNWCRTLEAMHRAQRTDRYVVTNNPDKRKDPFLVASYERETGERKEFYTRLLPCRNCLGDLDVDGYKQASSRERDAICNNFDLDAFLEEHRTFFKIMPRYRAEDAPSGGYSKNFAEISQRFARRATGPARSVACVCTTIAASFTPTTLTALNRTIFGKI